MMDESRTFIVKRVSFYPMHQAYLIISTAQWALALIFAWLTLRTWNQKMN
jgi:hypothetical protein